MTILISACLCGVNCRYDGKNNDQQFIQRFPEHTFIQVCPEQLGGLPTPRPPAEIRGTEVVSACANVTEAFNAGASRSVSLALEHGCELAILKERSPSCGKGRIYDGSFSHQLVEGNGITAQALMDAGIQVMGEQEALVFLQGLCDD